MVVEGKSVIDGGKEQLNNVVHELFGVIYFSRCGTGRIGDRKEFSARTTSFGGYLTICTYLLTHKAERYTRHKLLQVPITSASV